MPGHRRQLYVTASEWATLYGGKKPETACLNITRLPLGYCCLTFTPVSYPCCDNEGNLFEFEEVMKYIKKFKVNPVTGKQCHPKMIIRLNFFKSAGGEYHCPVTLKTFTSCSHVVAIKVTGNVFSYEAIENFNIKPKFWKDLISNELFQHSDLITLQNPENISKFNVESFYHTSCKKINVRKRKSVLNSVSHETTEILKNLEDSYKREVVEVVQKPVADKMNAAHYSTGRVAASLTSTVMNPETKLEPAILSEDLVRYERITNNGYVRLNTNMGPINLELYCNITPKTCENFIKLCLKGYYNNTIFHRSIRHFMIQGGDPTGTGKGGESVWGKPFGHEIKSNLGHIGRGVLSMVSSGPNTNRSQFFITYRSCKYLNGKHTIFGHVVGGLQTLSKMERIEVDKNDKPIEDIIILSTDIFKDPFQEVDLVIAEEREKLKEEESNITMTRIAEYKEFRKGVGKYIDSKRFQKIPEEVNRENKKSKKRLN